MKENRAATRAKAGRHTWKNSDAVKITFPDGTIMVGDKVVTCGRDAIVEGDRFIRWSWAADKTANAQE